MAPVRVQVPATAPVAALMVPVKVDAPAVPEAAFSVTAPLAFTAPLTPKSRLKVVERPVPVTTPALLMATVNVPASPPLNVPLYVPA